MDRQEFKNGEGRVSYPDSQADGYEWNNNSAGETILKIWHAAGGGDSFTSKTQTVFTEALTLLRRKHEDYGPKNISDAPGGPLNGLRVRMYDKIARINHLVDQGLEPQHESLRDSLLDCMNYCAIGVMVLDGTWPA